MNKPESRGNPEWERWFVTLLAVNGGSPDAHQGLRQRAFKAFYKTVTLRAMNLLTPLLFPFAVLYDAATRIRNRMYDQGIKPSATFEVPVISVGNLSVGGTGKSPMIEYLVRLLADRYRVATLSRGYGRTTRGIRIAGDGDNAGTIGDEPYQFFRKFKSQAVVAVGEERAFAIPHILDEYPETDVVLLDDAFQHRQVKPDFQILLTDYNRPFTTDLVLPAGRLRESKRGASRADVVVVTKCPPAIPADEMISIERAIRAYSSKSVFFSAIRYGDLLPAGTAAPYQPRKIVVVTGIANPKPMIDYLRSRYEVIKHFSFKDHHVYSETDATGIADVAAREAGCVVTTEKDVVKIDAAMFDRRGIPLLYLPIETTFVKNGKEFDEMVLNAARSHGK